MEKYFQDGRENNERKIFKIEKLLKENQQCVF
jgi:hypothetical protein